MEDIQKSFDAVYIAIGAHNDKKLGLEGEDSQNVISAVELLRGIGEGQVPDFTGKKVCVIGGGNVSMDATRTALRLGAERVTCVYRRRVEDMTALAEEIEEAMAEGCQILPLQAPARIEVEAVPVTDPRLRIAWPDTLYRTRIYFTGRLALRVE